MGPRVKREATMITQNKSGNVKSIDKAKGKLLDSAGSSGTKTKLKTTSEQTTKERGTSDETGIIITKPHRKKTKHKTVANISFQTYIRQLAKKQGRSIARDAVAIIDTIVKAFAVDVANNGYDVCGLTHRGIRTLRKEQVYAGLHLSVTDQPLRDEIYKHARTAVEKYQLYKLSHSGEK